MNENSKTIEQDFIETGGKVSATLGMGRIIGWIYALLFISSEPLCLDDMAERLGISKGSASMNIRMLQGWGAVREVWKRGDRKNFYEAERDLIAILNNGILETFRKKMAHVEGFLSRVVKTLELQERSKKVEDKGNMDIYKERFKEVSYIYNQIDNLLANGIRMERVESRE